MCRSIKQLRKADAPATDAEIRAAALQFVRKISGYRTPSRGNQVVFEQAVVAITASTQQLLTQLQANESPKSKKVSSVNPSVIETIASSQYEG